MQNSIFDLDGTVICSKHRYTALPDGGIDLPAWIRDSTRENCFKDSLLPAVRTMRRDFKAGCRVIICTSRVMSEWDFDFLKANNVPYHVMLDRPLSCKLPCADYKEWRLREYAKSIHMSWAKFCQTSMFFEDSDTVLNRMNLIEMPTIDAREWNYYLGLSDLARVA